MKLRWQKNIVYVLGACTTLSLFIVFAIYCWTFNLLPVAIALIPIASCIVGFTSLLYSRAQSYPDGALKRRTLVAAEAAFESVKFLIIGVIIGVVIWYVLYTIFGHRVLEIEDITALKIQEIILIPGIQLNGFFAIPIVYFSYALNRFILAYCIVLQKYPYDNRYFPEMLRRIKRNR